MKQLDIRDQRTFKASLQSGYGFTKSCQFILRNVKEMSDLVEEDESFKKLCEEAVKAHIRKLIQLGMKQLVDLNFDKFVKQNSFMTRFIGRLTLWGEFCTEQELDSKKLLKAVYLYRYPEEVATACGLTLEDLYDYIQEEEVVNSYLTKIGFMN